MTTATPDVHPHPAPPATRPDPVTPAPRAGHTPLWAWLAGVLVVAAVAGGVVWQIHRARANATAGGDARRSGRGAAAAGREQPVVVATARKGDLPVYLRGLGSVTPLETVNLRTRVDGAITQINYKEGQEVKKGDFLLQVDDRPYRAVLDQAKGQLIRDQATKDSADWNVQQDNEALKSKAIAEQQLHTDTAARDGAAGAIQVDKGNIEAAQTNVDYCRVTSPIDGTIGLRQVDLGNIVHASDTTALVVIARKHPITVVFTLPEVDLEQLQRRMNGGGPVPVDAYNANFRTRLDRGTILALDSAIDPTTLTIKVKAQFENAADTLYPSQAVNARVLVDTVRGAVLVPSAAIQHGATGDAFVYVAGGDDPKVKTVKVRPVTPGPALTAVGPNEADTTVISQGLEPGEVVVTDGVDKLTDGTKVSPRAAEDRFHGGATRPSTGPAAAGPMDQTGVGGPGMDGGVGGAGPTSRPAGGHRRGGRGGGPPANAS